MHDKPQILDISFYQGAIDWHMLEEMHVGVIARGGQDNFTDTKFLQHYEGALQHDVPFGIYWFYQPNSSHQRQVDAFMALYNSLPIAPAVISLDVEDIYVGGGNPNIIPSSKEAATYGVSSWLSQVEQATGNIPGIYTRENYWSAWMLRSMTQYNYGGVARVAPLWSHYWMWIAAWYAYIGTDAPRLPLDWIVYRVHQYEGGTGRHPAVVGPVDLNYYNGTEAEMYAFFGQELPTPPGPTIEERTQRLEDQALLFDIRLKRVEAMFKFSTSIPIVGAGNTEGE